MATIIPQQLLRAELENMLAYQVAHTEGLIKLDAMENPYPLPASLRDKWLSTLRKVTLNRYPDPQAKRLKQNFRNTFSISSKLELILGNGSDELIQLLILAIAKPNACILTVTPSFSMYKLIAKFIGVHIIQVPLEVNSFTLRPDHICKAIHENDPALIFLACPNNPTGTLWPREQIEQIVRHATGLVVIDEAYAPFAAYSMMYMAEKYSHVLILRTMSKMGLAGLRLGWLLGSAQWLSEINKLRLPYNVNALTQASVDFALSHISVFNDQVKLICKQREQLIAAMRDIDSIKVFSSESNFILFKTLRISADIIFKRLISHKIMIKNVADKGLLGNCLRVTVGTESENQAFLTALNKSLE